MFNVVIPAAAGAEFLKSLIGKLTDYAGALLADPVIASIRDRLSRREVYGAIEASVATAIAKFEAEVKNQALIRVINARPDFWLDPTLLGLLADAVIFPERRQQHLRQLTEIFTAVAPTRYMAEDAARVLIEQFVDSVLQVTVFKTRLEQLRRDLVAANDTGATGRKPLDHQVIPLPPLAPGLHSSLVDLGSKLAHRCGHNYVGTAHIFYALAAFQNGVSSPILDDLGLAPDRVAEAVCTCVRTDSSRPSIPTDHRLPETSSARQVWTLACELAAYEQEDEASDLHILEALLDQVDRGQRDGRGVGTVLIKLGITTAQIRTYLEQATSVIRTLSL